MKWLAGLVAVVAAAAVAVAVYVVLSHRDAVPGDVTACVQKAGLTAARSNQALSLMRPDILKGDVTVVRRWDWGRTNGVLLQGPARDYLVLALWNDTSPSLAGAGAGRSVYDAPATFPLVVVESPSRGVLAACARKA